MVRTERESDSKRREEKWQTCWCYQDQQRACRMAQASVEKHERTGPAEKERVVSVPQGEQLARTLEPHLEKEQNCLSRVSDHGGGESQGGRESRGSEREHEEERVDSTMKEGRAN